MNTFLSLILHSLICHVLLLLLLLLLLRNASDLRNCTSYFGEARRAVRTAHWCSIISLSLYSLSYLTTTRFYT